MTLPVLKPEQKWLVTGVAGFIGSNLLETLLLGDQHVVGLDNFATGFKKNLDEVQALVSEKQWSRFRFIEGDIRCSETCRDAVQGADYVLHQAALGSVPRSLAKPLDTNSANITGALNVMHAAMEAKVKRLVYAASSSTYGDSAELPKVESRIGNPLSPYAITKFVNELYADIFSRCYDFPCIGLRYFNVFGPRQDPAGAYAAVIPKWTSALIRKEDVFINGDGLTSRDFCYVKNAVQANLRAATCDNISQSEVFNVAVGQRTTLNELFELLQNALKGLGVECDTSPIYRDFRAGDVRHSLADISKAETILGYQPSHTVKQGISEAMPFYHALLSDSQLNCSQATTSN